MRCAACARHVILHLLTVSLPLRWKPDKHAVCRDDRARLYTGVASDASEVGLTKQSRPPAKMQSADADGFEDAELLAVDSAAGQNSGTEHRQSPR